jgi:hypothetical protein
VCSGWENSARNPSVSFCDPSIHPSMYGATAPSGAWPPSKRASTRPCFRLFSSILLLLAAVVNPSGSLLPIWSVVFPLLWKVQFKTFFGILSSSILIIWPAHPSLLIFVPSTMLRSLYRVYSSFFHLGSSFCDPPLIICAPSVGIIFCSLMFLSHLHGLWS